MYGMVNRALQAFVTKEHGQGAWDTLRARVGVDTGHFISMQSYPDAVTYELVAAASEEFSVPAEALLESFGRFWILFVEEEGYGELLSLAGSSFRELLGNLDNLHTQLSLSFPKYEPPSFRVEEGSEGLLLHYNSKRVGLVAFLKGLLLGLADRFGEEVEVSLHAPRSAGSNVDVLLIRTVG